MKTHLICSVIVIGAFVASGCNVGNAPPGMSGDDAKKAIAAMKPADRIRAIASSPMAGPEKEKEFAKIEAESGVKASDVLGKSPIGAPGAGQVKTGGN